jgi:hypothetical protein
MIEAKHTGTEPRRRLGLLLAGIYLALAAGLFLFTELTTKPGNVGLDWIPFMLLAWPWSFMSPNMLIPGVLINAGLLWLIVTLIQLCIRAARDQTR